MDDGFSRISLPNFMFDLAITKNEWFLSPIIWALESFVFLSIIFSFGTLGFSFLNIVN